MKVISLIVIAAVIGIHAFAGFYDFSSVTSNELRTNYNAYMGQSIRLKQVTILNLQIIQGPGLPIYQLDVWNGYTKFFRPSTEQRTRLLNEAIKVYARFSPQSPLSKYLTESENPRNYEIQVRVHPNIITLERWPTEISESWFTLPYVFALGVVNTILPLSLSVIIATLIQLSVIIIIVLLVIGRFIVVGPKVD